MLNTVECYKKNMLIVLIGQVKQGKRMHHESDNMKVAGVLEKNNLMGESPCRRIQEGRRTGSRDGADILFRHFCPKEK